jgi:formiminotetrahydrofolate cyclodeaminase
MPEPSTSLADWLSAIAAPTAAPAGGAAAALAASLGAALAEMVAALTVERPRYADAHEEAAAVRVHAARLRGELAALAVRDAEAFAGFSRARALPHATDAERIARTEARAAALTEAARVQLELLARVADAIALAQAMAERGLAAAVGDAATGAFLLAAAARSACWAIRDNLDGRREDAEAERMMAEAAELLERAEAAERAVQRRLQEGPH